MLAVMRLHTYKLHLTSYVATVNLRVPVASWQRVSFCFGFMALQQVRADKLRI